MNPLQWAKAEILHLAWKRGHWMPPDRRLLAEEILPLLAASNEVQRVLSVGVAWYTKDYEAPFAKAQKTFMTLEIDPERAVFGSTRKHVTGDVCELDTLFADEEPFDVILMNGVIGYGIDTVDLVERALVASAARLRRGGLLVLGVNEEKPTHVDPMSAPSAKALFLPRHDLFFSKWPDGRVTVEVPFREKNHTFLFWTKR